MWDTHTGVGQSWAHRPPSPGFQNDDEKRQKDGQPARSARRLCGPPLSLRKICCYLGLCPARVALFGGFFLAGDPFRQPSRLHGWIGGRTVSTIKDYCSLPLNVTAAVMDTHVPDPRRVSQPAPFPPGELRARQPSRQKHAVLRSQRGLAVTVAAGLHIRLLRRPGCCAIIIGSQPVAQVSAAPNVQRVVVLEAERRRSGMRLARLGLVERLRTSGMVDERQQLEVCRSQLGSLRPATWHNCRIQASIRT